jgi:hypothetical protein
LLLRCFTQIIDTLERAAGVKPEVSKAGGRQTTICIDADAFALHDPPRNW